jgi:hypothetical protein
LIYKISFFPYSPEVSPKCYTRDGDRTKHLVFQKMRQKSDENEKPTFEG